MSIDPESMHEHITVNVIGPAKVVETLQPFLKKGSLVMNMTSGLGSIGRTISDIGSKCTVYSISKGALNMLAVHQSFALKDKGVRVIVMDPG
jgi:NAD(P)-dependent dehydrogenase (short-subunit alcohol dehydrogenase family)